MAQRTFSNRSWPTSNQFVGAKLRGSYQPSQSTEAVQAGLTVTEAADTVTTAVGVRVTGTATISEAAQTLTGAVGVRVTGTATISEAAQTVTGAAVVRVAGTLAATEAAQTVTASGGVLVGASLSVTEAAHTVTTSAGVRVVAALNVTEAAHTVTASGTVSGGLAAITGSLNITEAADTITASGTVVDAVATASGLRPGGIGHNRPYRHLTIFPAPPEPEAPPPVPVVAETLPRKLKTKARKAAVAEIRKFAVAFIEQTYEPSLSDVMDRILAEARYQAFLAERANYERVQAAIVRLMAEAANDDEEAVLMLLAA